MRFSTWNVRSLCRLGTLTTVARELARYRLDLVGAQKLGKAREAQFKRRIVGTFCI